MSSASPRTGWTTGAVVTALAALATGAGILGALGPFHEISDEMGTEPPVLASDTVSSLPALARDPRVRALLESYGPLLDSVQYLEDDALFWLPSGPVHFQDGRMLSPTHLPRRDDFHSLFYHYSLHPLSSPPPLTDTPVYSTDLLEGLFGRTETQIRRGGVSTDFLGRKVFVNTFCLRALEGVERRIRAIAEEDPEVAAWIENIEVAYSFIDKEISGGGSRSHHAWGLAVDLVPSSYEGKHVYWRWSRVFNRRSWHQIPLEERWSPPHAVIQAFEAHGFVWGGKWSHFDTIHFEYRPEILAYNRVVANG